MASPPKPDAGEKPEFPQARVTGRRPGPLAVIRQSRMWWLTAACVATALALVGYSLAGRPKRITIRFPDGHGIKPGDLIKYRGIDIGEVVTVELDADLEGVRVGVALPRAAARLCREGSQFWIERPQVRLARVSGLETVVGAKFIGVLPGPADAKAAQHFQGLPAPPMIQEADFLDIEIRFAEGHGLAVGDVVKHRGIVVGEVTSLGLDESLGSLTVHARLAGSARQLARTGSRFWIERPRVSVAELRGLETVVSGRYLAVAPGPAGAKPLTVFRGLDVPPAEPLPEGGLEFVLEGDDRHGIQPDVPITYRGVQVGNVLEVGLAADGAHVEARGVVQSRYRGLVRDNSVFWSNSGIDVNVGLTGVEVSADTLSTVAIGGIALATPDSPGQEVKTGHRFVLHAKPEKPWLQWRPRISLVDAGLAGNVKPPPLLRATLRWKQKTLGIPRNRRREGWLLPVSQNWLLGSATMFQTPPEAEVDSGVLEIAGQEIAMETARMVLSGRLAAYPLEKSVLETAWPAADIRSPKSPEDSLVMAFTSDPLPLVADQFANEDGRWQLPATTPITRDWHGAPVVAIADGKLIGFVVADEAAQEVEPIGKMIASKLQ